MPEEIMEEQDYNEILRVRREKLAELTRAGKNPYELTKFEKTHSSREVVEGYDALEGKTVTVAGRIVSRRIMGKAAFCHILDGEGRIQLYVRTGDVPDFLSLIHI